MTPAVSIVIVTWNSESTIEECLSSIVQNPPSEPYEVILIDNDSRDRTLELAKLACPDLTVIRNASNRGLAAANNQGLGSALGEFVVISNPDVIYQPSTIDELINAARRHPRAAFVIPQVRYRDGQIQTSVGDLPSLREALLGRWAGRRMGRNNARSGFWWDGWPHDEELMVGRGLECSYLVRAQAVHEVGPQNEKYVLDWEGPEWSRRVHDAGWEIWFTPSAVAIHVGGVSIKQALPRWIVSSHRGMYMYFAERTPRPARPLLALVLAVRVAVKLVGLLRHERVYAAGYEAR
ncbi:MAG: glycosyltransferase family 2 protein [Frankiaceae bacterium]|nr:glycosyltransferase family 2 protein [Frankiaceae bacterium]